jgi:hypothetical protein
MLESDQRKERNDNVESDSVKRAFADSREAANTRINGSNSPANYRLVPIDLHERRVAGRVCCMRVVNEIRSAAESAGRG